MQAKGIFLWILIVVMFFVPAVVRAQSPSKAPPATATASSPIAGEEEVRGFLANYVDRYNQKDIDGFLTLFSPEAIQNQKERIGKIRMIYSNFFDQSHEIKFQMNETKVEFYQNGVEVKARYEITQTLRGGGEKRVWRGNGSWFLIKEDGRLRILYLNYQH